MNKALVAAAAAVISLFVAPSVAQADPDPNTEIIGNAGGGELPLPSTPGDGIGPGGALPTGFLLPPGALSQESIGPAVYSPLEDSH